MRQLNIITIFVFFALVNRVYPQSETNFGNNVLGAQLSITITNSLIHFDGTGTIIRCIIKNSSTNLISLANPLVLPDDTHLFLISHSGAIIELTPNRVFGSRITGPTIKAGEIYGWDKSFKISTNIESGKYELKAVRFIYSIDGTNHQGGKLISNLLNVQVK